ncbi:hypothetical protein C7B82_14115 [Stenomitos frigidus ULC18]|uniref:Uncharacterized protein n=1 Tax=Stenomitos frigidus ULC18 TaxID=2107698 RepID=A0A2T1E6F6_9CYAN|nr:hypothetical protein C7B82_14115 [Stenomitos frigidus ULC18]
MQALAHQQADWQRQDQLLPSGQWSAQGQAPAFGRAHARAVWLVYGNPRGDAPQPREARLGATLAGKAASATQWLWLPVGANAWSGSMPYPRSHALANARCGQPPHKTRSDSTAPPPVSLGHAC